MLLAADTGWIKDGLKALMDGGGPAYVLGAMIGGMFVYRLPAIINAGTACWKTRAETKQKIAHKQATFERDMEERQNRRTNGGRRRR